VLTPRKVRARRRGALPASRAGGYGAEQTTAAVCGLRLCRFVQVRSPVLDPYWRLVRRVDVPLTPRVALLGANLTLGARRHTQSR